MKATAWKYIRDECPAIAAIGPVQFLPDYNWFRQSTYYNADASAATVRASRWSTSNERSLGAKARREARSGGGAGAKRRAATDA